MIEEAIKKIVDKQDLTYDEAYAVMREIMTGATTPTQNAAYLAALSTKSTKAETLDEISGSAVAMRELATPVTHPGMEVMDIVGTGGDHAHSFNISTTAAIIVASTGVKSPSTATARPRAFRARPTAWRPWASTWTRAPTRRCASFKTTTSASSSRRSTIRP